MCVGGWKGKKIAFNWILKYGLTIKHEKLWKLKAKAISNNPTLKGSLNNFWVKKKFKNNKIKKKCEKGENFSLPTRSGSENIAVKNYLKM